jgi:hypothetical protein
MYGRSTNAPQLGTISNSTNQLFFFSLAPKNENGR